MTRNAQQTTAINLAEYQVGIQPSGNEPCAVREASDPLG